jgi:hypothetical protein
MGSACGCASPTNFNFWTSWPFFTQPYYSTREHSSSMVFIFLHSVIAWGMHKIVRWKWHWHPVLRVLKWCMVINLLKVRNFLCNINQQNAHCSCMKDRIFDIQFMCAFCVLFLFFFISSVSLRNECNLNFSFAVIINLQLCHFCLNAY